MTIILLLVIMLLALLIGVPVAFALGGLGLGMLLIGGFSPIMAPLALYSSFDSFILLSVPLFLLMSNILLQGGIGRDLFRAVQSWVGHWPGGLGIATIASCTIFSAISGSSVATAATIGNVAIKEMTDRGYNKPFVYGLIAAGGTLGILIPPSIPMIVYGVITEESIVDLFLAGIVPGLLMASAFIVYCFFYARFSKEYTPSEKSSNAERKSASLRALPTIALAAIIIGGIYTGVFTPTESAGVGVAVSLIIVILMRTFSVAKFKAAAMSTMKNTVTIFLIIAGAKVFGKAITLYQIPQDISMLVSENISEVGLFIAAVCFVLLIMGFFLESISMLLIMMPVLYPSLGMMGIDPIWFAIIFVIMIECALITPPVGLNLFVIQSVSGGKSSEIIKGVWPFILIMLGCLLAVYFFPAIALYIPFYL
ncbi:TRAP transporter large permease [Marinomonas primoryensis]|jgi:C4-dicarboxylate transporter DctM subunit|uniref:TRAP transporter large permease protein n=1 Tax=Marinomonas primoryensis TaxID=178399 RepID=A0A859CXH8_9GAMM|nr:TRAP transporter large permease [Marinomonas primoryensis]QKK81298.1 TRAP-type C4-dicarboxylate transport system large permease protein DctM [Marinomonas primoryensis]|tara:strand:- start:4230 stop:5501 length:1272 start_codon:yes stop_codon:yes gene_type:complete